MDQREMIGNFQAEMTSDKIKGISKELAQEAYEFLHQDYLYYSQSLGDKPSNMDDYFSWVSEKLDINIVYFEKERITQFMCFFSKTDNPGMMILHDLTQKNYPYELLVSNEKVLLTAFIDRNHINIDPVKIIELGIFSYGHSIYSYGKALLEREYRENFKPQLKSPFESSSFNQLRIHKEIYDFLEMIKIINNDQFTLELNECLEAYENEKFFVCAAGLGSVLEHLLYLAIEKHVPEDDIKTNENSMASEYIAQLRKPPFNANRREASHIKGVFAYRNSVSHFNKGIFSKDMCDQLLNGIKQCFDNYYMYEKRGTLAP